MIRLHPKEIRLFAFFFIVFSFSLSAQVQQGQAGLSSKKKVPVRKSRSDSAILDLVEKQTFNYFWEGAEPNSGMAPERIHLDGIYPDNDQRIIATGGSGFGCMAILAGIRRGYISREQGLKRLQK